MNTPLRFVVASTLRTALAAQSPAIFPADYANVPGGPMTSPSLPPAQHDRRGGLAVSNAAQVQVGIRPRTSLLSAQGAPLVVTTGTVRQAMCRSRCSRPSNRSTAFSDRRRASALASAARRRRDTG